MKRWFRTAAWLLIGFAAAGLAIAAYLQMSSVGVEHLNGYLLAGEAGAIIFGIVILGRSSSVDK